MPSTKNKININAEEEKNYKAAVSWCQNVIKSNDSILYNPQEFSETLDGAANEFNFLYDSMTSLFRNIHVQQHMKSSSSSVARSMHSRSRGQQLIKLYVNQGESILSIAKRINYPPYFIARFLIDLLLCHDENKKAFITRCMQNPYEMLGNFNSIPFSKEEYARSEENCEYYFNMKPTSRLSHQIKEALVSDPLYGPVHDKEKRQAGIEYEMKLQYVLKSLGIPFETEEDLRKRGTAKTPDILLLTPCAVRVPKKNCALKKNDLLNDEEFTWKMISWIDSKALFGDATTHNNDTIKQAEAFIHRYGPGLMVYWFGHAPTNLLQDSYGDLVISGYFVPSLFMFPTGDIVSHGCGLSYWDESKRSRTCNKIFYLDML